MAELDRSELIALLAQLGDPEDAVALVAARTIAAARIDWEYQLRMSEDAAPESTLAQDNDEDAAPPTEELATDAAIIDGLLARDLSDDTRTDLQDLKQALAAGEFSVMDSRYVRALAKRLGG